MKRYAHALVLAVVLYCGSALAERPPEWAQPITLSGAPNLHRIAPGVFRSAQPSALGMRELEKIGIRTVVSLRNNHDDSGMLKSTRLRLVAVPIDTWDIRDEHVVTTLRVLKRTEDGPFLIHCQHGADRTGLMSAMYRIVIQGWDKKRAIEELTQGGYGYHAVWKNIPHYIDNVDVDKIRSLVNG